MFNYKKLKVLSEEKSDFKKLQILVITTIINFQRFSIKKTKLNFETNIKTIINTEKQ